MLALVGTCCIQFETGQTFRPVQTDAALLASNTQHCWAQHVASNDLHGTTTMLAPVAHSLKAVKLLGPYKRTQLCWPTTRNNVVTCCVRLHGLLQYNPYSHAKASWLFCLRTLYVSTVSATFFGIAL